MFAITVLLKTVRDSAPPEYAKSWSMVVWNARLGPKPIYVKLSIFMTAALVPDRLRRLLRHHHRHRVPIAEMIQTRLDPQTVQILLTRPAVFCNMSEMVVVTR